MSAKLKQARLEHGYSIEDVSNRLNIRRQYLIGLEEGNFDSLPGKIYVDGYIKIYSKFLGVDLQNENRNDIGNISLDSNLKEESDDLYDLKKNIKYQKYFIIASIISLIIIFFSYNIIRSSDNTGINMFKEIIAHKFSSKNLYILESDHTMDYPKESYDNQGYDEDKIIAAGGIYIDQTLAEEDDMVMQEDIQD